MNPEQRAQLGKVITATAMYYQRQITTEVVSMMVSDLEDLPFEKVVKAYETLRRDPKTQGFPLPAKIRGVVAPTPTVETEARDVIEKIKIAIGKFGYMRGEEARAYVGEIGWQIVRGLGGWMAVCQSNFIHNSALIAQARARGEDLINFQGNITTENLLTHESNEQPQIEY